MRKFKIIKTTKTYKRVVPAKSVGNMLTVIDYNALITLDGSGLCYEKDKKITLSKSKK